jgi:putative MATE family efflux protein
VAGEAQAAPPVQTIAVDPTVSGISSRIIKLAWPVVIERFSISVLSIVDAVLVGRYVGDAGLAAVGIATLMFWIPLSGALAIDVGSTAVIARDVGAGDRSRVQQGLHTAILASLAWGIVCTAVVFALAPQLMRVMGAEPDVVPLGADYLRAGSLGFAPLMVLYAINGAFRGMGNTWLPMIVLIVSNAANAVVTFMLISGYPLELEMIAPGIGYTSAGVVGGGLALLLASGGLAPVRMNAARLFDVTREAFARLFRIGLPVGLEEAQFMLAFLAYTRIIAELGTQQLAAHAVALRSLEVAILPAFALATAVTALTGQSLGAGRPDTAEAIARRTMLFGIGTLMMFGAVQFTFAPQIVRIFNDDPEVVDTGAKLLRVFAIALPALGVHSTLSGALRGAGDVRYVLGTFTVTAWSVRVPVAALMVLGLGLNAPFAWIAPVMEHWTRAVLIVRRFAEGKWKSMRV